jgi:hypothetical protein
MSKASFISGEEDEAMMPKLVVPVRAFHPEDLLRIVSALEMCREEVLAGESAPTLEA